MANSNSRRERYGSGRSSMSPSRIKKNVTVSVNLDITQLDLMCRYIISSNKSIRRGNIINMRNMFLILDMSKFNGDQERLTRIDFIMKGIEARLDYNLTDPNMIISHISGGFGCESSMYPMNQELNNNEIMWVDTMVSEVLKDAIIYNETDYAMDLFTKFKAAPYDERGEVVKEIESWINSMQVQFRQSRAHSNDDLTFSLIGNAYDEAMRSTYRQISSPSNILRFGNKALNMLTGGGVEAGRVYTLLGLPGEGKSSTLIDMAIQIKRYNTDYRCNDPTKRPCVVLLIMENSIKETVQRLFNMCVGDDMLKYTEDEVINALRNKGNLKVSSDDPIDLIIKFKPNLSVDTSYLFTLTEDLEDEGYEVICMIQDYLKRIKSVDGSFGGELRLQLGAIVNEFKVFATLKNIPVITASQLNRVATNSIDEARIKNKADLVRLIGRANVGESNLILENSDWIALIAPEYDKEHKKWLGIQRVKSRYYIPGDDYCVYIPYIANTIKFVEDFFSEKPVHRRTMRDQEYNANTAHGLIQDVRQVTQFNEVKLPSDDTNNMFLNADMMI